MVNGIRKRSPGGHELGTTRVNASTTRRMRVTPKLNVVSIVDIVSWSKIKVTEMLNNGHLRNLDILRSSANEIKDFRTEDFAR